MLRRLLAILGGLIVVVALAAGAALFGIQRYNAPGPLATTKVLIIPRGGPSEVGETLMQAGVIEGELPFRVAATVTGGKGPLRAGEFTFPEHASLFAVLTILRSAKPVQHKLTIPEGLTAAQIAQILDRAPALDGDTPVPAEGEALPNTYIYTFGTARSAILDQARKAMDRALQQTWDSRIQGLPLTTPRQLLTLASIIERETARPEERPHIAAVFLNRLKLGMKLQSDPTVAYAVSGGLSTHDTGLSRTDLASPNPYNTYTAPGLPPGPIVSPGIASMQAVAQPLKSDDLYFVADGAGGHAFATTLDEHNKNVAKYRAKD